MFCLISFVVFVLLILFDVIGCEYICYMVCVCVGVCCLYCVAVAQLIACELALQQNYVAYMVALAL